MADREHHGVDLVVAQRLGLLGRLELGGEREVVHGPALGVHQHLHGGALAGARVADVDPLALEVVEGLDPGVGARDHGERLGMDREHRAQVLVRALALELLALALERLVLDVALHDAHVELALADGVDVVDRAAGALDRAADAVILAVLVDQPADRAAGRVVDPGDAAGADGDELLVLGGSEIRAEQDAASRQAHGQTANRSNVHDR